MATRGLHKDKRVHSGSKPTQKVNTPKDPHVNQLEEEMDQPGPQGSAKPTYGRLILAYHMAVTHWSKTSFLGFLSHLIFQRKPNASHMCARIKFTHI
jgi:hypothetical protein